MSWQDSVNYHRDAIDRLVGALESQWDPAVSSLEYALRELHKILFCGMGGGSALASHLASELVVRYQMDRKAYHAISLSDSATLTAALGESHQRVFARQVEAFGEPGDVLVVLTGVHLHPMLREAILAAKFLGLRTIGIGGVQSGCDVDIVIHSTNGARVRELSLLTGHLIIEGLEERLPK